ncbi:hypothetical protein SLA2020_303310 [Shorea laevis]
MLLGFTVLPDSSRSNSVLRSSPEDDRADGGVGEEIPVMDPENESVQQLMESLRLKFRAVFATLGLVGIGREDRLREARSD